MTFSNFVTFRNNIRLETCESSHEISSLIRCGVGVIRRNVSQRSGWQLRVIE